MFKKTILSFFILAIASKAAFADGKSYIGGSVGVHDIGYSQYTGAKAGAIGKVFGGYGYTFNKFYLGGELNFDIASNPTNYALGGSVIPGLMLSPSTMVYGRLGLQANHPSYSNNTIQFGNQLGLGLQTKISKKWDVRAEYISVSNVNKRDDQLLAGLVYNFN